ncbi:PAP2-domain-containing protein [Suhomyces tanzawaensis NRRL Y-17324]|uniref:PAP2-domain-containing protein n=1 Tax=Suhomyces tanzawaensis NRRL Y-17324 TaxID=984487 RepID=A0A1E4SDY2_9ASCO|nr:PAP2-domain-containing protein [Suhomyces tanzawaensis NRRL Y-17324]ODV77602.1 PAP2-domain-containing protein [Suhomyces tanzawaensis NRRL Y-17324]
MSSPEKPGILLSPNHLGDAGNKSNDHYKVRLSPFRYKIRSVLLPYVRKETEVLKSLQGAIRTPFLDFYFAWTANLASHTFYVLMLPIPIWFGASTLARDLVHVLGLGIYFTGFLKDYFCLPRPRSPPVKRITMLGYTAQEYGFPSSHSANATAVTLVLAAKVLEYQATLSTTIYYTLLAILAVYYVSLIFGRLYCGMHGFLDLLVGCSVGTACFMFRHFFGKAWDNFLFSNDFTWTTVVGIIMGYVGLIHIHAEPVDDCPCFDDSVAFIGVLIGLDLSHLVAYKTQYLASKNIFQDPLLVNYDYMTFGIVKQIARVALGVVLVVIWKAISKPIVFTILPPIYKVIGVYLPRRNFIATAHTKKSNRHIRSTSITNLSKNDLGANAIGDFNKFIKGVTEHDQKLAMGPETEIDYYEMLAYANEAPEKAVEEFPSLERRESTEKVPPLAGVFKPRYDVEIIGRLVVYAGVATTAVWGFQLVSEVLQLS